MTIEDFVLERLGLNPAKVNEIANNLVRLLGVVEAQMDAAKALVEQAEKLADVIKAEMPATKKLIADVKGQIAAYEAKQRELHR